MNAQTLMQQVLEFYKNQTTLCRILLHELVLRTLVKDQYNNKKDRNDITCE